MFGHKVKWVFWILFGLMLGTVAFFFARNFEIFLPKCSRTVTSRLPGSFRFLVDVFQWKGQNLCVFLDEVGKADLYRFDTSKLSLDPAQIIGDKQVLISWHKPSDKQLLLVVKENDEYWVRSLNDDFTTSIQLPEQVRKNASKQEVKKLRHFSIALLNGQIVVLEHDRIMRWKVSKSSAVRLTDISLESESDIHYFSYIDSGEGKNLSIKGLGHYIYNVDIESGLVSKVTVSKPHFESAFSGRVITNGKGKHWEITSDFDQAPSKEVMLNLGGRTVAQVRPSSSELCCFEKDKLKFRTFVSGNRNYANTGIDQLNQLLVMLGQHTVVESENWPYAPTGFKLVFFDKKDNPILWTNEEGLFKLAEGNWERLSGATDFGTSCQSGNGFELPDGRLCLLSGGVFKNPSATEMTIEDFPSIAIFDPRKNQYELMRVTFEKPYEWKEPPQ